MTTMQPTPYAKKAVEARAKRAWKERDRLQRELFEAKRSLVVGADNLAQTGSVELALELSALPARIAALHGLVAKAEKERKSAMTAYLQLHA